MKLNEITNPLTVKLLTPEQIKWLNNMKIKYSISPQGLVDVDGDVNISSQELTKIPVQFGKVSGHFFLWF